MTESRQRAEQVALFPLGPLPHIQCHSAGHGLPHLGEHLRLLPLQHKRYAKTKNIYMAQIKEQIKAPKIELSDEAIANLSDAEFKTMVIRMFTEMVEYSCKIKM